MFDPKIITALSAIYLIYMLLNIRQCYSEVENVLATKSYNTDKAKLAIPSLMVLIVFKVLLYLSVCAMVFYVSYSRDFMFLEYGLRYLLLIHLTLHFVLPFKKLMKSLNKSLF